LERDLLKEELQRLMKENQEARELAKRAQEGRDVARKEEQKLWKERDKAIEESLRARLDKELLEKKTEHLEKKLHRLSRLRFGLDRISARLCGCVGAELSPGPIREMEQLDKVSLSSSLELNLDKRAAEDGDVRRSPGENSDSSLHVEDMGSLAHSLLPGAPSSTDEDEKNPLETGFYAAPGRAGGHLLIAWPCAHRSRHYNSQDAVIQQAKLFLKAENNQVLERRPAQRQAPSTCLFPNQEESFYEGMKVGQLGSPSQPPAAKRVTFDITESDLSSTVDAPEQTGAPVDPLTSGHTQAPSLFMTSRPLFTRFPTPLTESSKVQLGLDDNDEIRVYYY
ncbi:unnamed protein product, partial [Tetraodon nigroviridis]